MSKSNPIKQVKKAVTNPLGFVRGAVDAAVDVVNDLATEVVSWFIDIPELPDVSQEARGALVNKESTVGNIPIVYGERRTGGYRIFVETSGSNNTYLYMCLVMCEGEIESITDLQVNDEDLVGSKYAPYVQWEAKLGTDTQTASTVLSPSPSWGTNDRLLGLAYVAVRLTYNQDIFGSVPTITALVKGRKVYDPRDATTAYSSNPALCLRDYLTNTRYGKGLSTTLIDDDAFEDAADKCETQVETYSGSSAYVNRFDLNAIINTGNTLFNNVSLILGSMQGMMPYQNGLYRLIIEDDYDSTFDFTTDNIIDGIDFTGPSKKNRYNRVTAKFINPDANWQGDSVTWPDSASSDYTTFLSEDNNVVLEKDINLTTVTNFYQARNIAKTLCLASRKNGIAIQFSALSEALECAVGDVVTITHPTPAWTSKEFRVTSMSLNSDGTVDLSAIEHTASVYPWVDDEQETAAESSTLPDPLTVQDPTSLTATPQIFVSEDGTAYSSIEASWVAPDDDFVEQYELQYRKGTDNFTSFVTRSTTVTVLVDIGEVYDFKVRAINSLGVRSGFIEVNDVTAVGDTSAPSVPTSVTATGGLGIITLDWTNSDAVDLNVVQIWENSVDNSASATQIAVSGSDQFVRGGLSPDVTRYYWLKSVDHSGNVSAFHAVNGVSATTDIPAVKDRLIGRIETVDLLTTGLGTADEGKVEFLTTDSTLYKWTGTAWTSTFDLEDETGKILAQQIDVATLSAITANIGTVTAGTIKDTDDKFKILLDNKRIEVYDENDDLRVQIGYFGA